MRAQAVAKSTGIGLSARQQIKKLPNIFCPKLEVAPLQNLFNLFCDFFIPNFFKILLEFFFFFLILHKICLMT